jgi:cytidylate kinase
MGTLKQVVFIGGPSGSGKSTICRALADLHGYLVAKQRHILISLGERKGLWGWENVGPQFDDLIGEATEELAVAFRSHHSQTLLFDSHYALRTEKALRLRGKTFPGQSHIVDLDYRLVECLAREHRVRFVLLLADFNTLLARVQGRPPELLDYDHTPEGLAKQVEVETENFCRIVRDFGISHADLAVILNNADLPTLVARIRKFIGSQ